MNTSHFTSHYSMSNALKNNANSQIYFLWGLKRSGIHFFVNWLYHNLGATQQAEIVANLNIHPQLQRGFYDPLTSVAFFNNCGHLNSRDYQLGAISGKDFRRCAEDYKSIIFGLEDADLKGCVKQTLLSPNITHIILLRDPLNNIASRKKAAQNKPDVFPTHEGYLALYENYCKEVLQHSNHIKRKYFVSYNRMVLEPSYRKKIAARLKIPNFDYTDLVSAYGDGSSFTGLKTPNKKELMTRFKDYSIPTTLLEQLKHQKYTLEVCRKIFGYDLNLACDELILQN